MAANSKISWTHSTFNPWIGCTKVHEGCAHCYAESLTKRTGRAVWGPNGTRSKTSESYWREPLKWDREAAAAGERRRVFCASLADVFEDWGGPVLNHHGRELWMRECGNIVAGSDECYVDDCGCESGCPLTLDDLRQELFKLIDATPNLDWLLLTKRPENIGRMWPTEDDGAGGRLAAMIFSKNDKPAKGKLVRRRDNVWLGTSISNQATADKFVPELLKSRDLAPVLFLSAEPLLGTIDLTRIRPAPTTHWYDCLEGREHIGRGVFQGLPHVDQVIAGVESRGKFLGSLGEFESEADWLAAATSIVEQCSSSGVAPFVKQVPIAGKLSHDPEEWPESLRVRQFPTLEESHA